MSPSPALASVSVDKIANAFIAWAEQEPGRYWWWPRDIRLDPDEVIADDGEGNTYRVPFQTDGELDVTFGDPVEVRETFVDVAAPAAAAAAATARVRQRVLARDLPKPEKTNPDPAASAATTQEDDRMTAIDIPALRSRLQLSESELPDDATPEQINQALAAGDPQPDPTPDPQPEGDPAPEPEPTPEPTGTEPVPAAATADTVTVSRSVWEQTTQRLDALEQRDTDRQHAENTARRDNAVATWVREGRIAPAERDHYRQMLDVDETRTTALAASLQAGRVPIAERGHDNDPTTGGAPAQTGWFKDRLPQEA